jgi:uncharacterized DUF497 family protein
MANPHFVDVEWDEEKNILNQKSHGVSFEEAATILDDPLELTIPDPDHSISERRFLSLGYSTNKRLLVVSYAERAERIRIISARKPTKTERKFYEEA